MEKKNRERNDGNNFDFESQHWSRFKSLDGKPQACRLLCGSF